MIIATDDGSIGTKGNVIDAARENAVRGDMIYSCGPVPMQRGVKAYAAEPPARRSLSCVVPQFCLPLRSFPPRGYPAPPSVSDESGFPFVLALPLLERDIPFLKHYDTRIIVNVCGKTAEDYVAVVEKLADTFRPFYLPAEMSAGLCRSSSRSAC